MKPVVQKAYVDALREGEAQRRAANVALVSAHYKNADAREMSRREYSTMQSAFLKALRGAPVNTK